MIVTTSCTGVMIPSVDAYLVEQMRLRRDVVRTANNPIGDIAEAVVTEHYNGERQGFSNSGWDVTATNGERLEVKGIRLTGTRTRANLSPIPATSTYAATCRRSSGERTNSQPSPYNAMRMPSVCGKNLDRRMR